MVGGSREGRERRPIYQNGWLFTAAPLGAKAIDGDVYAEHTLCANSADLADISLRQRILRNVDSLSLKTTLFGKEQSLPIILSPVGLIGM